MVKYRKIENQKSKNGRNSGIFHSDPKIFFDDIIALWMGDHLSHEF